MLPYRYVQSTLDNWNTHGRRKFQIVPIMETKLCTKHRGMEWKCFFQIVPIIKAFQLYIRVPIIEGRLYFISQIKFPYIDETFNTQLFNVVSYSKAPRRLLNCKYPELSHFPITGTSFSRYT